MRAPPIDLGGVLLVKGVAAILLGDDVGKEVDGLLDAVNRRLKAGKVGHGGAVHLERDDLAAGGRDQAEGAHKPLLIFAGSGFHIHADERELNALVRIAHIS